jgi:hypothetical protein
VSWELRKVSFFPISFIPVKRSLLIAEAWSRPLPRPIIIPDVMELTTLADVRILVEKHLPKVRQSRSRGKRPRSVRGQGSAANSQYP